MVKVKDIRKGKRFYVEWSSVDELDRISRFEVVCGYKVMCGLVENLVNNSEIRKVVVRWMWGLNMWENDVVGVWENGVVVWSNVEW